MYGNSGNGTPLNDIVKTCKLVEMKDRLGRYLKVKDRLRRISKCN